MVRARSCYVNNEVIIADKSIERKIKELTNYKIKTYEIHS